jgi:hypothetical protein
MDIQKKRNRSRGYPAHDLKETVQMVEQVKRALGKGDHLRGIIASALKLKASSGNRRIAAMAHFGLLDLVRGKNATYRISDLANQIISPVDEKEKVCAIQAAALEPTLFREVFERFSGEDLPDLLPNVLERDFGIVHKQARDATDIFLKSMEYSGLLRGKRLGVSEEAGETHKSDTGRPSDEEHPGTEPDVLDPVVVSPSPTAPRPGETPERASILPGGYKEYQVVLDLSRLGYLRLPEPVSVADLEAVSDWIDYTKKRLQKVSPTDSAN